MIVTREWLREWVDIKDISTDKICETFNSIGLEVDSLKEIKIPSLVVVGKVIECEKHPDADKLSVCQVDVGDEIKQIVCGAKNVAKNQFVPVALKGAGVLSKDGKSFKIDDTTLRGVESKGMICSSTEIGLPFINDGILELDSSIGELIIGKELKEYQLLNDDIIEIELTANRGDCQNIYGVARDLSVALDLKMKKFEKGIEEDRIGIARALKIEAKNIKNGSFEYAVIKQKEFKLPLLIDFRVAISGKKFDNDYEKLAFYSTYNTGVMVRLYSSNLIKKDKNGIMQISIKSDNLGIPTISSEEELSKITLGQNRKSLPTKEDELIIAEATYIEPNYISKVTNSLKERDYFYNYIATRGSNPNIDFGLDYLFYILSLSGSFKSYTGRQQVVNEIEQRVIIVEFEKINNLIGQVIEKNRIVKILQSLGFELSMDSEESSLFIKIPNFRHDIINFQDIIEEIVRIIGINNIKSTPIILEEKRRINNSYLEFKKREFYRVKSANSGFFESLHYFFTSKELAVKYGFKTLKEELELSNPITNELNTIRPTLLLNLLNGVSNNYKFGKKSIRVFELGSVVDENRNELEKIAFVFSGFVEREDISNSGKPKEIDFFTFANRISNIIGEFEIENGKSDNLLTNPYEYGKIIQNGKEIGFISRVHLKVEEEFSLPKTYIAEIDFSKLEFKDKNAKRYSKFPSLSRDLSLLVPKSKKYGIIREFFKKTLPKEVKEFYPIDIYQSEELGENFSLTIKFIIQSEIKTLEEEEITEIMQNIIESLDRELGIKIR